MSVVEVLKIIRNCTKCSGSRTQMVNHGDGGGWGITQCSCMNELDEYLYKLTTEERQNLRRKI